MNNNWKLKLVEIIPYLVLAITLLISVVYEKNASEKLGRVDHGPKESITLKSVVSSGIDH